MALTTTMKEALDQHFNWTLTNVPELEQPVLIVLDYSPSNARLLLSIAFDFSGGAKCWLTASKVTKVGNAGPKPYNDYRKFVFKGQAFHPYSIKAFQRDIFDDIQQFRSACAILYQHVDWS